MRSILKTFIAAIAIVMSLNTAAQNKYWLQDSYFTNGISFNSASIKINGVAATYDDLLKIEDTSVLKIEVYNKKTAIKLFGKDEGKKGVVLVTTRTYKPVGYTIVTTADSAQYFVIKGDTIFARASTKATIGGDTSGRAWNKFLERNLNAQIPADNGAPPGRYRVTVRFIIGKDGSVSDASVDEDPGYGTGQEVLRLMSKSPAWQPALYNGQPVKIFEIQNITFEVSEM